MKINAADFRHRLVPILGAQGVGFLCGVAGVALVSRIVAPADYGAYAVFTTLAAMGAGIIHAGSIKFVTRHWQSTTDRRGLLIDALAAAARKTLWLLSACVAAALLVPSENAVAYGLLLFVSATLLTLTQLTQSALQASREHWRDLGISAGMSVTRSFAPPLIYALTSAGLVAMLAGFTLHALAGALLGAAAVWKWASPRRVHAQGRTLPTVYAGPLFITLAAAGWILAGLNRWVVMWFYGAEQAGYFTLATNLGAILPWMAGTVFIQYVQPQWFDSTVTNAAGRRHLLRSADRVALTYTGVALAAVVTVHLCMPLLTGTLINVRYASAGTFVFAVGCSAAASTIGTFYHTALMAAKRERACAAADLSGAGCLCCGAVITASIGMTWFTGWLLVSPLVPWLVNRTLARRALLRAT